ncbi:MAG: ubiquinone biosynthesis protein UbiB, partial [Sphingomicrobium sp.]
PEAQLADRIIDIVRALKKLPHLIDKIDANYPEPGAAPQPPPLTDGAIVGSGGHWRGIALALISALAGAAIAATILLAR